MPTEQPISESPVLTRQHKSQAALHKLIQPLCRAADDRRTRGYYAEAERNLEMLFQNTNLPPSQVSYRARLYAGAVALERLAFNDAMFYFTNLIKDASCPTNVLAEVYFALGDTLIQRQPLDRAIDGVH